MEPLNQPTHLSAAHLCQRQPGAGRPDGLLQPPKSSSSCLPRAHRGGPSASPAWRAGVAAATGRHADERRGSKRPFTITRAQPGFGASRAGGRARKCGEGAVRISCQMNSGGRDARGESLLMRGSRGGARARQLTWCRPLRRRLPSRGEASSHCVLLDGARGKGGVRIVSMRSARCLSAAAVRSCRGCAEPSCAEFSAAKPWSLDLVSARTLV